MDNRLTNYEIKQLLYLLGAKFFAGTNADAAMLKVGSYQLWFWLDDNTTRVYDNTVKVDDPNRELFLDLLIGEFFYQVDELGNKSLLIGNKSLLKGVY